MVLKVNGFFSLNKEDKEKIRKQIFADVRRIYKKIRNWSRQAAKKSCILITVWPIIIAQSAVLWTDRERNMGQPVGFFLQAEEIVENVEDLYILFHNLKPQ